MNATVTYNMPCFLVSLSHIDLYLDDSVRAKSLKVKRFDWLIVFWKNFSGFVNFLLLLISVILIHFETEAKLIEWLFLSYIFSFLALRG